MPILVNFISLLSVSSYRSVVLASRCVMNQPVHAQNVCQTKNFQQLQQQILPRRLDVDNLNRLSRDAIAQISQWHELVCPQVWNVFLGLLFGWSRQLGWLLVPRAHFFLLKNILVLKLFFLLWLTSRILLFLWAFNFLILLLNLLFAGLFFGFLPIINSLARVWLCQVNLILNLCILHKSQRPVSFVDCQKDAIRPNFNSLHTFNQILMRQISHIHIKLSFMLPFYIVKVLLSHFFVMEGQHVIVGKVWKSFVYCWSQSFVCRRQWHQQWRNRVVRINQIRLTTKYKRQLFDQRHTSNRGHYCFLLINYLYFYQLT